MANVGSKTACMALLLSTYVCMYVCMYVCIYVYIE